MRLNCLQIKFTEISSSSVVAMEYLPLLANMEVRFTVG